MLLKQSRNPILIFFSPSFLFTRRKCTDHDVIGSAVSGDEFNINVDPAKAAEIRSVNSTDISYSELEVTVGTDAAAGDEAGRRFKDYV